MDPKPLPSPGKMGAKSSGKRSKATTETARLFLDVEELIRRSQTAPTSRYVE
jgi:hypothetical protein